MLPDAEHLGPVPFMRSAKNGFDAKNQFAWTERFHHIVIGAELKSDDTIDFFAACGEHDDGYAAGDLVLAQSPANFHAVDIGKHQVENDQIGRMFLDRSREPCGRFRPSRLRNRPA